MTGERLLPREAGYADFGLLPVIACMSCYDHLIRLSRLRAGTLSVTCGDNSPGGGAENAKRCLTSLTEGGG